MINIVFDATMLNEFQLCQCKFNYRHNLNKVPTVKAKPLDKGGVLHVGLENYFLTLAANGKWEEAVDRGLTSTREALNDSDLDTKEGNRILEVIEENTKFWKHTDLSYEILGVEEPFTYILYSDDVFRIIMIGKIDLRINAKGYSNLPMDHKSYERDYPLNDLSNQFTNYANALNSPFVFVNRVGFQTSLKPEQKYKRVPLSYDPLKFEQWKNNTIKWAMLYYDCVQNNDWPMNLTSCDKFNRLCEYHGVCNTSGEENKIYKLNAFFATAEPWDVSKALTKKG